MVGHDHLHAAGVGGSDGVLNELVAREELEVDQIDQARFRNGDIEGDVVVGRQFGFAAFVLGAEGEENGLIRESGAQRLERFENGGGIGDGSKVVAAPFENVEVCSGVGGSFGLHGGEILGHKRNDDLGGAFAHGDVLDLNGLHDDIECSGG